MVKNLSIIGRLGNKTNDIKFFCMFFPDVTKIKNIIEPFGGSYAVSKYFYKNNKNLNYYVNDNDECLCSIYKNPEEYINILNDADNCYDELKKNNNIVDGKKVIQYIENKNYDDKMTKYFKDSKLIKGAMYKRPKNNDYSYDLNFMKIINFYNDDWEKFIKHYLYNNQNFIFLDPPYLFSNNSSYMSQRMDGKNGSSDNTDMIYKIYEIFINKKIKSKIMFIINDMKILRWLFKDFIKGEYEKIYQIGKRKEKHLIITNY